MKRDTAQLELVGNLSYHFNNKEDLLEAIVKAMYYQLDNSQAIVEAALEELDGIFNGVASQSYTGEYIITDWGQQINTLGTWTNPLEGLMFMLE